MIAKDAIGRCIITARAAARQRGGMVGMYTFGINREVLAIMPHGEKVIDMSDPYKGYIELAEFVCKADNND